MTIDSKWWKDANIYQIWPASYKDSNGDGVGDIPGIISTLDYLKDLGTDIIWLSPMYDSPQEDMGYDISDYRKVYPKYGTMEDMDELIDGCHKRGMRLILDLVVNHTSDQHRWFEESRSSLDNPKRDWYTWKKPRYDDKGNRRPPNNWLTYFSESAWTYDERTDEYYLHLFAQGQPDLNWENPETRNAIYDEAMIFWLDKGIDGFRIDTAGVYSKVQTFEDAPIIFPDSEFQPCTKFHHNGPRIHEFHKEMYEKVYCKYDVMTVGEVGHCTREEALKYVSASEHEMSMIFIFDLVELGCHRNDKFTYNGDTLKELKKSVENQSDFLAGSDGWSTIFSENHDLPRSVTRFGDTSPKYFEKSAKLLALMLSTLTGTLFIYQGQEIGMTNVPRSWDISEYKDLNTINYYEKFKNEHGEEKEKLDKLMDSINLFARDNSRTPIQWDSSENGGFTTGTPWTRVNTNYKEINVELQLKNSNSILSFYREVLKVRKEYKDLLIYGDFKILDYDNEKTFTYVKVNGGRTGLVVLNFSSEIVPFEKLIEGNYELVISNTDVQLEAELTPWEARFYVIN